MRIPKIIFIFVIAMLTGCTHLSRLFPDDPPAPTRAEEQMKILKTKICKTHCATGILTAIVPDTKGILTNFILVGMQKVGWGSATVDAITRNLKKCKTTPIGVVGDDDRLVAATVELALKRMRGFKTTTKLYFVGDPSHCQKLKSLADSVGVNFEGIPYP